MEKAAETEFKFNAFWVSFLSIVISFLIYSCINYFTSPLISWENFVRCVFIVFLCFLFLPLTFKMIFNIPAVVLTNNHLRSNMGGKSIEWNDIADMRLVDNSLLSFANLNINLKNPEKYFDTALKKAFYKFKQNFSANDISIKVDFVAGSNEVIFQAINAYWTKHRIN